MFEYNKELKKLPIPDLKESLERYQELVKPLLTGDEFASSKIAIDSFMKEGSSAFYLHKKLMETCYKEDNRSWLLDLWIKMYLEYRKENAINVNYYAVLENRDFKDKYSHCQILAIAIYTITKLYFSIVDESLEGEKKKGIPLCMKNYNNIFAATRIPDYDIDKHIVKEKSKELNHIAFMYRGNIYIIQVSDEEGNIYSVSRICDTLETIVTKIINEDESCSVGTLTCSNRDKAAFLYKKLSHSQHNIENFKKINDTLAFFCLDGPATYKTDFTESFLLSDGKNRFFDKATQIILTYDKEFGINNEHSHSDAGLYTLVLKNLYHSLKDLSFEFANKAEEEIPFERLEWERDSELKVQLKQAEKEHLNRAKSTFTKHTPFLKFGKDRVKEIGISPDAFFHLSLQLAQFRTFGKLRSTYEAIDMREYREGRTECARPVNRDTKEFAETFDEMYDEFNDNGELRDLIKKAAASHVTMIKKIKNGEGIERYLFGLEEMNKRFVKDRTAGKFFNDIAYKKLKEEFISSSNFGSEFIKAFGFGNVHQSGYGIGYSVNQSHISLSICSSWENRDSALKLMDQIHRSFLDISRLFVK